MTPSYVDEQTWWTEGFEAYVMGVARKECPYSPETESASCWMEGWNDAEHIQTQN
ncbi:hypothetical protein CPT_Muldoon_029 [Serratia phage Muldoon]|uniref:Ribosome modulation factor n=1 Tax=Serratia phage Muldoon TaxID=2601678 RepID=A0A5P8PH29_9CAUD|nr:hypothetical protein HYP94_gp029 [Serratia phage Muldoon]QFR55986.1 hypothetical protein CPT_Muldoon_029 [Serratia phage Muldoon]